MSKLSVSYLNLGGVNSSLFGNKLLSSDFVDNILKHDVNIFGETWGSSQNFDIIEGYTAIVLNQNKHDCISKGRSSGGIVIWYKDALKNHVTEPNYIWVMISSLAICGIYIPPESSKYFDKNIFDNLSHDIAQYKLEGKQILLLGDLNARTSNFKDFLDVSEDKYNNPINLSCEINDVRNGFDGESNKSGHLLLDLCKSQNLRIVNGRTTGDSYGRFTSYNVNGGASVVDYAIVPDDQFNKVDSFVVRPPNLLSDHCQIIAWIDTKRNDTFSEPTSTNYKWQKVPTKFKWKTNSKSKYSKALQSNKHTKMILNFRKTVSITAQSTLIKRVNFSKRYC